MQDNSNTRLVGWGGRLDKHDYYFRTEQENGDPKLMKFAIKYQIEYCATDIKMSVEQFNEEININCDKIENVLRGKLMGNDNDDGRLKELLNAQTNEVIGFEICHFILDDGKKGYEMKFFNRKLPTGKNENELIINLHIKEGTQGNSPTVLDFLESNAFGFLNLDEADEIKPISYNDEKIYKTFRVDLIAGLKKDYCCNAKIIHGKIEECRRRVGCVQHCKFYADGCCYKGHDPFHLQKFPHNLPSGTN